MFNYRDAQASDKKGPQGVMIFNPGTLKCYFPSWNGKTTLFRPLPEPIMDNNGNPTGQYSSWRCSAEAFHFSNWIVPLNVVKMWGDQYPISAVADLRKADGTIARHNPRIPDQISAFHKVYETIRKAVANGTAREWEKYIKGGKDRGAPISYVSKAAAMQGYLYEHNGNDYHSDPMGKVGLILARSACDEIEELLNAETPTYNGDPEDYAKRFISGDVTSPEAGEGRFIKVTPREATRKTTGGYDVAFEVDDAGLSDMALKSWTPWISDPQTGKKGAINFLSYTEQVTLCMKAVNREVVHATFKDEGVLPEGWMTNRVTVDMGAQSTEAVPTAPRVARNAPIVQSGFSTSGFVTPAESVVTTNISVPTGDPVADQSKAQDVLSRLRKHTKPAQ